ncbi:RTA1 like protein-domain-containing protein [Annulohypoxylon maeteangense]|uniref:RTA1 like protein-domain-containing protein n=1 Tax=Annulohypoxylon maeteangense TaxID=1927788 RepID=UPI0020080A7B|nr:RTA1 like protein-domain-containing protein [Annulohypoxylon maeteangense]KAI0890420.1 RTA1 like protein-domain-containing protein [Annulohypoxylon maeteangense]
MRSIASCNFETCPVAASPYGYPPSAAAEVIFLFIHIGSILACLLYTFYIAERNKWLEFSIPVSIASLFEAIGYAVRLGSSIDPWDVGFYAGSTAFLLVAPAFISAAIYLTIPEAIKIIGVEHSLINVAHYPRLIWIDVIGFVFQLIGIIVSFSDLSVDTGLGHNAKIGSPIMAAGTAIQALSLIIFIFLFVNVLLRAAIANSQFGYTTFHPVHGFVPMAYRFKFFVAMLLISAICLFGRDLYQVIILADGLESWNAKNQALFAGLDSLLVAEAVAGLVVAHPVRFLQDGLEKRVRSRNASSMMEEPRVSRFYLLGNTPTPPTRPNRSYQRDHTPRSSTSYFEA